MKLDKKYLEDTYNIIKKFQEYLDIVVNTSSYFFEGENSAEFMKIYNIEDMLRCILKNLDVVIEKIDVDI